ncbi:MAG: ABC transporter substrate-binding protein, partial [Gaiellaceae bacterium]
MCDNVAPVRRPLDKAPIGDLERLTRRRAPHSATRAASSPIPIRSKARRSAPPAGCIRRRRSRYCTSGQFFIRENAGCKEDTRMPRARTRDRRKVAIIVSLALLLASAALAAAATAKPERAGAPAPSFELRIGNVLPFTGDLAPYGPGLDQAARMAADRINASLRRLGLSGQISVTIVGSEDSQTQAAAAVEAAKKLVNIDRATVLIGDMASNSSIPMAQSV